MTDTTMLIAGAQADAKTWKARAEAAEARCARLEKAAWPIWRALNLGIHVDLAQRQALFAALSDTAQQETAWQCKARINTGPGDSQDCDWPVCGCDPYADKVIAALEESGGLPLDPDQEGDDG